MTGVDLGVTVGTVHLPNPVMTASGTAGHGDELAGYVRLGSLGAVVVKSIAHFPWKGNPALRTHGTAGGMINSVGLQGPGMAAWLTESLPRLEAHGARVVASIWGRNADDYRIAADQLAGASDSVVAVEVNLSCPNTEAGGALIAHDAEAVREIMAATAGCERERWAKLSPNTAGLPEIAAAARDGGASAVTLVNTVLGMVIDPVSGRYALGAGAAGGGLSGPAIHPVAVRAVHDVHRALPDLPIVGVGGVSRGADALELIRAGASAVQVGTATLADPRAPAVVLDELADLCRRIGVGSVAELVGTAHA